MPKHKPMHKASIRYSVNAGVLVPVCQRNVELLGDVVDGISRVLAADNPRFDRNKFVAACGMTPPRIVAPAMRKVE